MSPKMSHMLHKKLITDALTPSGGDESLMIYPRLLKIGPYHLTRRLFSQRQISLIQSVALLMTICVTMLVLAQNLAQTSLDAATNAVESTAREEQTSPRVYASSVVARAASEIIPRVIMSRQQMEDVRRELDGRRQRVARMCETIVTKRSYLNDTLTNMIVDTEHNVSWCPIYKAASSMWMNYFVVLRNALTDVTEDLVRRNLIQVNDIVRQKFRPDANLNKMYEKMMRTKKFLIVRHPLERLLSAYRDKLERVQGREYYYRRFGRHIVLKYRRTGDRTKLEPTFEEFLRFVVEERYFDEHWAPYYRTCEPCIVRYDYILKFETLERDQNFFVQDVNLSEYLYERKNYPRNSNPRGTTTREVLGEYVREVPRELLDEIYKIYENDYKLFGYSYV